MATSTLAGADVGAQCQFINAFYAVTGDDQWWTTRRGTALLHQVPVLLNGLAVDEHNAFLEWFRRCARATIVAATEERVRAVPKEREMCAPILQTCKLVAGER